MRVKVEGLVDFEQVCQIIQDLYQRSPPGSKMLGLNLYLNIRDAKGVLVEFLNPQGEPIDVLTYREDRLRVPVKKPAKNSLKGAKSTPSTSSVLPFQRPAKADAAVTAEPWTAA